MTVRRTSSGSARNAWREGALAPDTRDHRVVGALAPGGAGPRLVATSRGGADRLRERAAITSGQRRQISLDLGDSRAEVAFGDLAQREGRPGHENLAHVRSLAPGGHGSLDSIAIEGRRSARARPVAGNDRQGFGA